MNKHDINEEIAKMRRIMGLNEIYDDQEDLNDPAFDPWKGAGGQYPVYETDPGAQPQAASYNPKNPGGINLDEYFDEVDTTTPYGSENGVVTPEFVAEKDLNTDDEHNQFEKQMLSQKFLNMLDSDIHELDMLKKIMYEKGLYSNLLKFKSGKLSDPKSIELLFGELNHLIDVLELPEQPQVKIDMLNILNQLAQPVTEQPVDEVEVTREVSKPTCACEEMQEGDADKFNQPDYKYYVIDKNINKIITGFEYREDGVEFIKELVRSGETPNTYVLSAFKYAKMRGLDPDNNESWGTISTE